MAVASGLLTRPDFGHSPTSGAQMNTHLEFAGRPCQCSVDVYECEPNHPSSGEKCVTVGPADVTGALSASYRSRGRGMFPHTTLIRPQVRFIMEDNAPGGRPALSDMGGNPQTPRPQPMS